MSNEVASSAPKRRPRGYKVCWRVRGSGSPDPRDFECKVFSTRGEAERFAAARSEFNDDWVSVHEWFGGTPPDRWYRSAEPWLTIYAGGWLKDSQKKGAYIPPKHQKRMDEGSAAIERARAARRGEKKLRDIDDPRFGYNEHVLRHENDSFARGSTRRRSKRARRRR